MLIVDTQSSRKAGLQIALIIQNIEITFVKAAIATLTLSKHYFRPV